MKWTKDFGEQNVKIAKLETKDEYNTKLEAEREKSSDRYSTLIE